MNPKLPPLLNLSNSGLGCLLTLVLIGFLLGSVGLGWVVNGFLILIALLITAPIIAWFGLNWWVRRNLISQPCPVCGHVFTSVNHTQCECPNCGEPLEVEKGLFQRITPPGTIDVTVVND